MSKLRWHKGNKGFSNIIVVVMIAIMAIVVAVFVPIINTQGIGGAVSRLEIAGYTVIASADYDTLNAKLDNIKVSADAAVVNANAAVVAAQTAADKVDLFNSAEEFLFPDNTADNVTVFSDVPNVWSDWAIVTDNNNVHFDSFFAADPGYIADVGALHLDDAVADSLWIVEIAYGTPKVTVARIAIRADAWNSSLGIQPLKSRLIPAGSTVYARVMSDAPFGSPMDIMFRYFFK